MEVFKREALATELATKILTVSPTSASSSGLFLAAPRRTGKSTFLREDLRPALENLGALVVYADLWEDRRADPGEVIVGAVRAELASHEGVIKRLARSAGMEKVAVGGMSFSLDRVGLGEGISLSAALAALSDDAGKPIVLVIDEAQQAIVSEKGNDALFALKAARDELNSSRHKGLRIVATGSNRDKLAMLRNSRDQAFYGAPLVNFPALDMAYVQWFCDRLDLGAKLDPAEVFELFKRAAFRPELLGAAADALRFEFGLPAGDIPARFAAAVEEQIAVSNTEQMRVVHSLTPLQSTVLRVMAVRGSNYAPFEAATMEAYDAVLKAIDPGADARVDVSNVQQALSALQDKALVWRAARGVYALEETGLASLMQQEGMLKPVPAA
ncbi:ATP-binding protein [Cupriavidus basilensis]|uniref:ATP-binding protein n=1 Tax=Cupriavidus basilensis TaxID=68895 RepID=A0A643FJ48_9BURK|nr:ATP-binding protein [Cupriavidus basilensis]QOT82090.1 ATP-binding protein [Cupriavidus basilensis]